jgi:hypothetical protein
MTAATVSASQVGGAGDTGVSTAEVEDVSPGGSDTTTALGADVLRSGWETTVSVAMRRFQ